MAFTYDLSTDVGMVRLTIQDTGGVAPGETAETGTYAFADAEITALVAAAGSLALGYIRCLDVLITNKTLRAKQFTVPGLTYNDTARLTDLRALRDTLAAEHGALPPMTIGCIGASSTGAAELIGNLP